MFQTIYLEEDIQSHPKVEQICQRFPHASRILCRRYGEVFNRKAQNFRLQKEAPALILAKKYGQLVLETPKGYGIGKEHNYYFSHMLNCLYDCRYCFLQGMYSSANYVHFVNFEDFEHSIETTIASLKGKSATFFSGYDCDSLAMENITHFAQHFVPFFKQYPEHELELRTKSNNIQPLIGMQPLKNCIVAYTLTPQEIAKALEHRAPSLEKRIQCIQKLAAQGWPIGLRFDPMIFCTNYQDLYRNFFHQVFEAIDEKAIHSVSLGAFRLPKALFKRMHALYPEERLFSHSLEEDQGIVCYKKEIENEFLAFCEEKILKYVPRSKFFPCFKGIEV